MSPFAAPCRRTTCVNGSPGDRHVTSRNPGDLVPRQSGASVFGTQTVASGIRAWLLSSAGQPTGLELLDRLVPAGLLTVGHQAFPLPEFAGPLADMRDTFFVANHHGRLP